MTLAAPPPPAPVPTPWTQVEALALATLVEQICQRFGCHVALTGGALYKLGPRKDCDLLFYRIRQAQAIDKPGLFLALREELGLRELSGWGWCHKAEFGGKPVDCLFPESTEELPPEGSGTRAATFDFASDLV